MGGRGKARTSRKSDEEERSLYGLLTSIFYTAAPLIEGGCPHNFMTLGLAGGSDGYFMALDGQSTFVHAAHPFAVACSFFPASTLYSPMMAVMLFLGTSMRLSESPTPISLAWHVRIISGCWPKGQSP